MKGVYEAGCRAGRSSTDARAEHLLVGELIDVKKAKARTEKRMNQLSKVDWKQLPLEQDRRSARQGRRQLAVFSDPLPVLQKLEATWPSWTT